MDDAGLDSRAGWGRDAAGRRRLLHVAPSTGATTTTFVHAHTTRLPADVHFVHGRWRPMSGERPVLSRAELAYYRLRRVLLREPALREVTAAYVRAVRRHRAQAVLAEFGPTSVRVMEACRRTGVPLIAHFHGYDASVRTILDAFADRYRLLFRDAAAIIAVSHAMRDRLVAMGAPAERVHWNPCGVDPDAFAAGDPATAPPVLVAVGRFVEKKGPTYTLRGFARALERVPTAQLRMVGTGKLLEEAKALAGELGIGHAVAFLGDRSHADVGVELRAARAFVQHSLVAASGDSEGTPVSILEAGASGLPVIATRHAGIPDVVIEGQTGFLVEERDVEGMAAHMARLLEDPALAGQLGRAARTYVVAHHSMQRSIGRLWDVIESCILEAERRPVAVRRGG